jgi:HEAT repeat protein
MELRWDPMLGLLLASVLLLGFLVVCVITRKLRRDAAEAAARGRRARLASTLADGDERALGRLCREARSDLAAQHDLALACVTVDPLPADRRADVHRALQPLIDALVRRLGSRDPVERGQAAIVLTRLRVPHAETFVAPLLKDGDPDVRLAAVGCLAWLESARAARALIAALGERDLPPERLVERLGASWAVSAVVDALKASDGGLPRNWLARALGLAGDIRAQSVLIDLLRTGDPEERISAARALRTCGGVLALRPLIEALEDAEWPVRGQAAASLGQLDASDAVPALTGLLADPAWWVRARAAEALQQLGETGRSALERAAGEHPDRFARDRALAALGQAVVIR